MILFIRRHLWNTVSFLVKNIIESFFIYVTYTHKHTQCITQTYCTNIMYTRSHNLFLIFLYFLYFGSFQLEILSLRDQEHLIKFPQKFRLTNFLLVITLMKSLKPVVSTCLRLMESYIHWTTRKQISSTCKLYFTSEEI